MFKKLWIAIGFLFAISIAGFALHPGGALGALAIIVCFYLACGLTIFTLMVMLWLFIVVKTIRMIKERV